MLPWDTGCISAGFSNVLYSDLDMAFKRET